MDVEQILAGLNTGEEDRLEAAVKGIPALTAVEAQALYERLLPSLVSTDLDRRWWAVRILAALPVDEAISELISALDDAEPAVRQCAALGLLACPQAGAVPALLERLDDPDMLAARLAADALEAVGAAAVPALIEKLQTGSREAQRLAVRALAKIGDTRAIPALFAALDSDSQLTEYWAGEGLERMGVGMSFFNPGG